MRFSFLWCRRPVRAHEREHSRGQLPPAPSSGPSPARGKYHYICIYSSGRVLHSWLLLQRSSCLFDVRGINGPEIVGCDPRLNADAEEITRFFISHLKKPCACSARARRTPRSCVDRPLMNPSSQASKSAFKELTKSVSTTLKGMQTVAQFGDYVSAVL